MQFDQLGDAWRRHLEREHDPADIERVSTLIERVAKDFERKIWYRDVSETTGAVITIVVFGYLAIVMSSVVARLGCAINVAGFIFIVIKLWRARHVENGGMRPLTLVDGLQVKTARILRQIGLLKSVVWWCLCPTFLGCNLIVLGFSQSWALSFVYLVATVILGRYVWSLNQRAVRDDLEPILAEIESVSRSLQSESVADEHSH